MPEPSLPEEKSTPAGSEASRAPANPAFAGFFARYVAFSIDFMIIAIFLNVVISLAGLLAEGIHGEGAYKGAYLIISFLFSNIFFIAYFTWFHSETGESPGKWLLGIRVVSQFGGEAGFTRSLFRSFGYYLSFAPMFAGFLWVLINPTSQSWHDKLAGTFVVNRPWLKT